VNRADIKHLFSFGSSEAPHDHPGAAQRLQHLGF